MITSAANPVVKQARALRRRKVRDETGLFLVEGIHPVGEAIEAGWKIESILYAPDVLKSDFAHDLIAHQPSISRAVSTHVMESLAEKENPQGFLAVIHQKQVEPADLKSIEISAALVAPQDPGNVGTILRTLDALGGDVLFLLDGGVDPYHPSSVRASMGAVFWIPVFQMSFRDLVHWARQNKTQLIGSSAHGGLDHKNFELHHPWLLLLGSEQTGLSAEQQAACDITVSIPMRGRASSLNLAVAAGILLYEISNKALFALRT